MGAFLASVAKPLSEAHFSAHVGFSRIFADSVSFRVFLGEPVLRSYVAKNVTRGACTRVLLGYTRTVSLTSSDVFFAFREMFHYLVLCEQQSVIDVTRTRSILSSTSI